MSDARIIRARQLTEQMRHAYRTQNQALLDTAGEAMDREGLANCFVDDKTGRPYAMAREIAADIAEEYETPAPTQLTPADVQEVARGLGLALPELSQAGYTRDEAIAVLQHATVGGANDDLQSSGWSDDGQPIRVQSRVV